MEVALVDARGENFIFNERYLLKNDKKRYLLTKKNIHDFREDGEDNPLPEDINVIMHPLIALLLALFDGTRSLTDVIDTYSNILGGDKGGIYRYVVGIVEEILNLEKGKCLKFADDFFYIPQNVIVPNRQKKKIDANTNIEDFLIPKNDLDLHSLRTYMPLDCIMEVNFKCVTDCLYCYADRRNPIPFSIPIERLKEIIKEAKQIGMRTFDLCGGELFLCDKWEIIVRELVENGFKTYISTKIPITGPVVKKLKGIMDP